MITCLGALLAATPAHADGAQCRVLEVEVAPAALAAPTAPMQTPPQLVAWVEDTAGRYIDTAWITAQTGRYGLGNRPGRFDFNTGPQWPYGRRITTFPVWAHRHGKTFPELVFQDAADNNLSHQILQSSREPRYCLPLRSDEALWAQADAGTCASTVYTDKGKPGGGTSLYPPRADLAAGEPDDPAVATYAELAVFDAVSQATPRVGAVARLGWSIPLDLPAGDYVLWLEVSRELDHNATYSTTRFPAPTGISFADWGLPYRGQPSVVYRVPFTLATGDTVASALDYAGYGDPDGASGVVNPPDATITSDVPGSGAQRLALLPGGGAPARVRVTARPAPDVAPPAAPGELSLVEATSRGATVAFIAPGDDGLNGSARAYEVRVIAGDELTEDSFAQASPVAVPDGAIVPGGNPQTLAIGGLLFETRYALGVRAIDDCGNHGPLSVVRFTTAARATGEVDACFVATAAYGTSLATSVDRLRRFRDVMLGDSVLGQLAVATYYTFGPAVAGAIGESDLLRATARAALAPLVTGVGRLRFTAGL